MMVMGNFNHTYPYIQTPSSTKSCILKILRSEEKIYITN